MSETNAQEPTMEEILASIRRIISEDDAPAAEAPAAASAPSPAKPEPPKPEPEIAPPVAAAPEPTPPAAAEHVEAEDDDVLELNEPLEPAPAAARYHETLGDLDVFSPTPSAPASFTAQAPAFQAEPLVGSYASETSAGHFGALARSVSMPKEGRSLEDVVRELLKPMLRDWLDHNLPAIVEGRVQAEVERISRRNDY